MPTPDIAGVAEATSNLDESRRDARNGAWDGIGAVFRALHQALGPSCRLRGMPNLASSSAPFRALRVRAQRADKELPFPRVRGGDAFGTEVLVLTETAALKFARRDDSGQIIERDVFQEDVRAEDVEHVAETLVEACARHIVAADQATETYDDLYALSQRLREALGDVPTDRDQLDDDLRAEYQDKYDEALADYRKLLGEAAAWIEAAAPGADLAAKINDKLKGGA